MSDEQLVHTALIWVAPCRATAIVITTAVTHGARSRMKYLNLSAVTGLAPVSALAVHPQCERDWKNYKKPQKRQEDMDNTSREKHWRSSPDVGHVSVYTTMLNDCEERWARSDAQLKEWDNEKRQRVARHECFLGGDWADCKTPVQMAHGCIEQVRAEVNAWFQSQNFSNRSAFDAYVSKTGSISMFGTEQEQFLFNKCISCRAYATVTAITSEHGVKV